MSKPEPARYRTTNWQSSNDVLQRRGSLLVWLGREMDWLAPKAVKPGRPRVFSDAATQFCLMIKVLFGRPLRQTTGVVASLPETAGRDWPVPDFSTLGRRQNTIAVRLSSHWAPVGPRKPDEREWLARKHGTRRCHSAIRARGRTGTRASFGPVAVMPLLPSAKTTAFAKKIAAPRSPLSSQQWRTLPHPATKSRGQPGASAGRYGKGGPATVSAAESRPG